MIEIDNTKYPQELNWPLNKKHEKSTRFFSIWKSKNGKTFYNTWTKGSNKMPSSNWKEIENFIITNYINV